jgi:REP element-mobilizing transposase RayT
MGDTNGSHELSEFERRHRDLPHWEDPGATYVVRFSVWRGCGVFLDSAEIAPIVVAALRYQHGRRYWLYDYTVMPEHVHVIIKPITRKGKAEHLWQILRDLKGWMARRINDELRRSGSLWRDESWDRIIRDDVEYDQWSEYILRNAQEAGLVEDPCDWPWWGRGVDGPAR